MRPRSRRRRAQPVGQHARAADARRRDPRRAAVRAYSEDRGNVGLRRSLWPQPAALSHSFYTAVYGDRIAGLPSFSIVRDPVDRLLSAYRFIRAGGTAIMATSHFERAQLPRSASFAEFVAHLARHPATIGRLVSLRLQSGYILDAAGGFQVDRVFLNEGDGASARPCRLSRHRPHSAAERVAAARRAGRQCRARDDRDAVRRRLRAGRAGPPAGVEHRGGGTCPRQAA